MHNGGCVKEETNYHFNCVIRLGKLPFVLFAQIMFFSGPFSHIVGMGNGMIDLIVQTVSVEIYENRDKSRKSTKFGIHVLEGI